MTRTLSVALIGLSLTTSAFADCGVASTYGEPQQTASGERFNPNALTAASRTLPLGTKVRVRNERTGKAVIVRINDRGPYVGNRLIDLSTAAARSIGVSLGRVCIEEARR